MTGALFEGYEPPPPTEALSADRRRTQRQHDGVQAGRHPLTRGPLHPEASRGRTSADRIPEPFTCGTCVHRQFRSTGPKTYAKCVALGPKALSHSPGTDVCAWWPACPSYTPPETP